MFRNAFLLASCLASSLTSAAVAAQTTHLRVGWCTTATNISEAPFAVAKKFGWFAAEGLDIELVPIATGADCVKFVATGEVPYAAPSIEPTAALIAQGLTAKVFYTVYQDSPWSIQVPAASTIKTVDELKGKRIGVISLGSVGASIVKGILKGAGLDPEQDVSLIAVGDAQRAAYFLERGEVDAVSIFDLAHFQIEAQGIALRQIDVPELASAPSLGLIANEDYLAQNKDQAIRLGRAYSKGLAFTFANPQAAETIFYEVFPEALPEGKSVADVHRSNLRLTEKHAAAPSPWHGDLSAWGLSRPDIYDAYLDRLHAWGLTSRRVEADEVLDNGLIEAINDFDRDEITRLAASTN